MRLNRDILGYVSLGLVVVFWLVASSSMAGQEKLVLSEEIKTSSGPVVGVVDNGIIEFRGIPYAKAPVGELRFQPPQDHEGWENTLVASQFGPAAPQVLDRIELTPGTPRREDNCLTLNIFAPKETEEGDDLPVMVFIHGGGWVVGYSGGPWYHGDQFIKRGNVIYVSINYRLGALGFLHLDELLKTEDQKEKYQSAGNVGILDQAKALEWIKNNIEAFHGDKDNITIFGESAGGISVCAQMVLGETKGKGLFQRAIVQSGGPHFRSKEWAKQVTLDFIALAHATDLDDLLAMPTGALIAAQRKLEFGSPFSDALFGPCVDGKVFTDGFIELIDAGTVHDVPLIIGTNLDEMRYWMWYYPEWSTYDLETAYNLIPAFTNIIDRSGMEWQDIQAAYENAMPGASDNDIFWAVFTDLVFRIPSIKLVEALEEADDYYNSAMWMYLFTWPTSISSDGITLGAMHAIELPFVFYDYENYYYYFDENGMTPDLEDLAAAIQDAWLGFAKLNDPGMVDTEPWAMYSTPDRATMILDIDPELKEDPQKDRREFWDLLEITPFTAE